MSSTPKSPRRLNIGSTPKQEPSQNVGETPRALTINGQEPVKARTPMRLNITEPKTESETKGSPKALGLQTPTRRNGGVLAESHKAKHRYEVEPESEVAKQFTKDELARAIGIAAVLDINDHNQVLDFAIEPQMAMAQVTDMALEETRRNNFIGKGSELISMIVEKGKSLDLSAISKHDTFFSKAFSWIPTREERLRKFEQDFNTIVDVMDASAEELADLCDELIYKVEVMEELYKHNYIHFKELSVYIAAGEIKLNKLRTVDLPALIDEANSSSDAFKQHEVRDLERAITSFEQKLHDLKLTRMSTLQTAPQLRIVQANNRTLVDKIHSTIMTVIPLWKKQFIMAMALADQQDAMQAQKKITNAAKGIMRGNADLLKKNSVELAQEIAHGNVSLDDIQFVQERLMETISETMQIKEQVEIERKEKAKALEQIDIEAIERAEREVAKTFGS